MNNYERRTRGCLRQPWIASPHIIGTYRKCSGGFAKAGRALPCPPTGAGASPIRGLTRVRSMQRKKVNAVAPSRRILGIDKALQM
ncbi:MAG: hypothetical protein LBM98_10285 [Oscillospiraceae bacterium]|nr:hypothetical protein [Oscillospiraceae bacterium]